MLRGLLRSGLRNMTHSTQRNRDRPGAGSILLNNTMGHSQTYTKMGSDNRKTSTQKQANNPTLAGIDESKEDLPSPPPRALDYDLERGGILKTEEVEVHYEHTGHRDHMRTAARGLELAEISPVYIRSTSRIPGCMLNRQRGWLRKLKSA